MRTLYLECSMGAAGDMLLSALSELLPEPESFVRMMNELKLPGVEVRREYRLSAGIRGVYTHVGIYGQEEICSDILPHHEHNHEGSHINEKGCGQEHTHTHEEHHHASLEDIRLLIENIPVSQAVRQNALAVYQLIAEAESKAHGRPVAEIHFHEVGMMDAVADIVGVCILMERLDAEQVICGPVHVGSGMVRCAHGVVPVPAPATAIILQGIPYYGGTIEGELCTPTGAALLKYFSTSFGPMPVMTTEKIGIGIGAKEFSAANMLRVFWGETNI